MGKMSSPKFIISKGKVLEQFKKLENLCDVVSYSSKTNPIVTKILEENTNCMFSIHFVNELKHIKDNSRVLFLAQGWNHEEIKELINRGINYFVVDNESDLSELESFLESNEAEINLLLRVRLKEKTIRTERYFVFGMLSEIVNKKVKELRTKEKIKDKIKSLGIHFHRKTQNMAEWSLKYEFEEMIDKEILSLVDIVNIGGGLPSDYANTNTKVIETILLKIEEFRKWLDEKEIKLMVEPGRFIAAPAGKLLTEIKTIDENNIVINASVYNSDMDALIVPVKLLVEGELKKGQGTPYVIKGITPCSTDLFRYRVFLDCPKVGDKFVFLNAGAYNFTTNFCDLNEIETEIVENFR